MFKDRPFQADHALDTLPGYQMEWCRTLGGGEGMLTLLRRATLADPSLPRFLVSLRRGEAVERQPANSIYDAARIADESLRRPMAA